MPSTPSTITTDVVVVGGGHNGLITAGYLARAGLRVCVVEQNERCGGALFSSRGEAVMLEHGAIDHSTIVGSQIPADLELERHGLRYIHRLESAMHVFGDGARVTIGATAEATAESIGAIDAHDAEAWLRLSGLARRFLELNAALADGYPIPLQTLLPVARRALGPHGRELVELASTPITTMAERWFRSPEMRALAVFRSQFSGLPGWHPGTAAVFCLSPASHGNTYSRPEGGSAAFVDSLVSSLKASGGVVINDFPVAVVSRSTSGWQVVSTRGEAVHASTAVVSAIAPRDFLLKLLRPRDALPAALRTRVEGIEESTANLSQFSLAAELSRSPDLTFLNEPDFEGSQLWLLTEPDDILRSQKSATEGVVPTNPAVLATFPTILDPSLASEASASMWINGFIARELNTPGGWSAGAPDAVEKIWGTVDVCLPGIHDHVSGSVFTSPEDLTRRTGATNPGLHVSPTLQQLHGGRPVRGAANHRSGVPGLYLTGAGTNPGASISGLPGQACAMALLADLEKRSPGRRLLATSRSGMREFARARRLTKRAYEIRRGRF